MGIVLLIFSFVFTFSIFFVSCDKKLGISSNIRLAFVKSSLLFSLFVVFITEILSFFNAITEFNIAVAWLLFFLASFIVFLVKKNKYNFEARGFINIINFLKNEKFISKINIVLFFVVLISLFGIAFTINNNWDSYTYHLPKIEHWIQDENVNFYPTSNVRQLYLAPFSEYFILNIRLLSNNILFINFVQFFSFINCILIASLIAKLFGLNRSSQLVASILVMTIPMAIMQSTTTQTDLVVSFYLISFVYFIISIAKENKISMENSLFLGLSFALGILTKSTFYIFAFPFCLLFGVYFIKIFKFKALYILLFVISLFLLLNSVFLYRNYNQFGSLLGPQKTSSYYLANLNEDYGVRTMLSNSVKNAGLHLALPNDLWNKFINNNIQNVHNYFIKFPVNYNKTNWLNTEYATIFVLHHDLVGNFAHIVMFFVSIGVVFFKFDKVSNLAKFYALIIVSIFLLFAFLLKWQPWQTRLDLPIFVLTAPFLAYAMSLIKPKIISDIICTILLFIAISILFIYDPIKPIVGKNSIFLKNNNSYVFEYAESTKIKSRLKKEKISNVGLILGGDSLEWQYWLLMKNIRFEHIYFNEDFLKTPNFDINFKYKALIIENNFLEKQDIKETFLNSSNIKEIITIDERLTVVIFKERQKTILTYK